MNQGIATWHSKLPQIQIKKSDPGEGVSISENLDDDRDVVKPGISVCPSFGAYPGLRETGYLAYVRRSVMQAIGDPIHD